MQQLLLSCLIGWIALSPAWSVTEYCLGGADGNAWATALSLEGSSAYVVLDAEGQEMRRVGVKVTPHGAGTDTLIDFSGTAIQPRFVEASANMVLADLESDPQKIPLLYTGGKVEVTNSCVHLGKENPIVKDMFDGNPATAMFRRFTQDPDKPLGYGNGWAGQGIVHTGAAAAVVDLGAAVPVNRIRFYPRLSRVDDRLLIEEFTAPKPALEAFGQDSFVDNLLEWYEIRTGDDTAAFASGTCDVAGFAKGLRWVQPWDPQLKVLKTTTENLDVVVDLRFPTQSIRWITLQPFPRRNWEIAEFEVYGEGFVEETTYLTQILDFGQPINWGKIRWSADVPEGTRIEIRTRTGQTPDPSLYFAENTNGDLDQIALKDYLKIDVGARLAPVYDTAHWSFWSTPYEFASGLRDEGTVAAAWADGTALLSPGPSQYIQVEIKLYSTFTAAPRLEQLSLQFAEVPSAQEVVGEIWPIIVEDFTPTTFTYVVRPIFGVGDVGFDHLEIRTPTRVDSVRSVLINDQAVDFALFPPVLEDDRLIVGFPPLRDEQEDSFKQIEVIFDATVLRFGTEFSGWVFNSTDADQVRQQIQPGNATFRFSGDALSVKTPLGGDLLIQVEAGPGVFTPNGDGVNDKVVFSYKLREVATARPVSLRIYDLAGRVVHILPATSAKSGAFEQAWNGRNAQGQLLPPGTYLYELTLETKDQERQVGSFAIAY